MDRALFENGHVPPRAPGENVCEAESESDKALGAEEVTMKGEGMGYGDIMMIEPTFKGDMMLLLEKHIGTTSRAITMLLVPCFCDYIRI